jgi:hypothetical protein
VQIVDESDLSSYEAAMCKWNEKNEDEKYALLITDSSQKVLITLIFRCVSKSLIIM